MYCKVYVSTYFATDVAKCLKPSLDCCGLYIISHVYCILQNISTGFWLNIRLVVLY